MNKNNFLSEVTVSIMLILLVIFFLDPLMLLMPDSLIYMITAGLIILLILFIGFVWRERIEDERDELHRMIGARVGYLTGISILIVGIIYQTFSSQVDPWLVISVVAIIIAKIGGHIYSKKNR